MKIISLRFVKLGVLLLLLPNAISHAAESVAVAASGDESLFLQDIPAVYAASKYEQKVSEAPSSVSIITAEEIRRYGHKSLVDVLRSVRGFYASYDRNYSYLGVRGFGRPTDYNNRVLVLIDGHRINEGIFDGAYIGTAFMLSVDVIDRIEIIRGPGSSLYGTNAIFAVINVITKRGRDLRGGEVAGEIMSYDTRAGTVSYGSKASNGMEWLASASSYHSGGQDLYFPEFNSPSTNNGNAIGADTDTAQRAFGKMTYGNLTLEAGYVNREKHIPTASYNTQFNNPNEYTIDERTFLFAKYVHEMENNANLTTRVAIDSYNYNGRYPEVSPYQDFGAWRAWLVEAQYVQTIQNHKLLIGADFQRSKRADQWSFTESPYTPDINAYISTQHWSVYLQDEYRLNADSLINVGVRHDGYEDVGTSTNPRIAYVTNLSKTDVLKLMYGQAYRVPNVYELYYYPSPWLQPEQIKTYELALEHTHNNGVRGTISLFSYNVNNLIEEDNVTYKFYNVGRAEANGIELGYEGRLNQKVDARFSLTYQNAKNTDTGEKLTNSPDVLAKLNINSVLLGSNTIGGLEVLYTDRRLTLGGGYVGGATIVNTTIQQRNLVHGLHVSASIYNLTDKQYADPAGVEHVMDSIAQDGRNYRIKLTYEF